MSFKKITKKDFDLLRHANRVYDLPLLLNKIKQMITASLLCFLSTSLTTFNNGYTLSDQFCNIGVYRYCLKILFLSCFGEKTPVVWPNGVLCNHLVFSTVSCTYGNSQLLLSFLGLVGYAKWDSPRTTVLTEFIVYSFHCIFSGVFFFFF